MARHRHAANQQHQHSGHGVYLGAESLRLEWWQSAGRNPVRIIQRQLHGGPALEEPLLRAVQRGHRAAVRRQHHPVSELCRFRVAPHGCRRLLQHRNSRRRCFLRRPGQRTPVNPILTPFRKNPGTTMERVHPTTHCRHRCVRQIGYRLWSISISYTWSKTLNEGGDGYFGVEGGVPEDPYNPKGSRGPAGFNIPQIFVGECRSISFPSAPARRFQTGNRMADYVIGNWQVNGIVTGRSGQNFNVAGGEETLPTPETRARTKGQTWSAIPYQSGPIAANPSCTPPAGPTRTRFAVVQPLRL